MKNIKFNKYINLIGIEFEGGYKPEFVQALNSLVESGSDIINDVGSDGSVHFYEDASYQGYEVRTKPLNAKQLTEVLDIFSTAQKCGQYKLNTSTGLHYHVSFKDTGYGQLCNGKFYRQYIAEFQKRFPKVYANREYNRYCRVRPTARGLYDYSSRDRYNFINFCYARHSTIEFRGYGGELSTVEELRDVIQMTINLVGKFLKKERHLSKIVDFTDDLKVVKQLVNYAMTDTKPVKSLFTY